MCRIHHGPVRVAAAALAGAGARAPSPPVPPAQALLRAVHEVLAQFRQHVDDPCALAQRASGHHTDCCLPAFRSAMHDLQAAVDATYAATMSPAQAQRLADLHARIDAASAGSDDQAFFDAVSAKDEFLLQIGSPESSQNL